MWRFGIAAIGIAGAVAGFGSGTKLSAAVDGLGASKPLDIARIMADEAEKANRKKGSVSGHSTFVGAEARGGRLSYLYEVNLNPRAVNTAAVKDEFYRKAIPLLCKSDSALRRAVMQGASLEYAYRTAHTKQHLFEVHLNASSCRT